MKKKYIRPFVEAAFMEANAMLAESLPIYIDGPQVPGGSTQAKKNDWDIFGTDGDEPEVD